MFEKVVKSVGNLFKSEKTPDLDLDVKNLKPEYRKRVEGFNNKLNEFARSWDDLDEKGGVALDAEMTVPIEWYNEEIQEKAKSRKYFVVFTRSVFFSRYYRYGNAYVEWVAQKKQSAEKWLSENNIKIN